MTRVEDALKKLRERQGAKQGANQGAQGAPAIERARRNATPLPRAQHKKVVIEGPRHHVSQEELAEGGLLAPDDLAVPVVDEFRRIKRPLLANATSDLAGKDELMNVIMIASALPGAGKTFCSVNLAVSISLERELNVLLVDADVAKPHISKAFGLADAPGLIDLLLDEKMDLSEALVRTDINDIQVLPAGRHHKQATELLASERMSRIVHELAERYTDRIIVLDSPPLMITSEAQALSDQVGQIVMVVECGRTSQQALRQTLDSLDPTKAINLILNKSSGWSKAAGYYDYAGQYGYAQA